MKAELIQKYRSLVDNIREYGSAIVAFSGGVDSALLAKAAYDALGIHLLLVTCVTAFLPDGEREAAKALAQEIGARHEELTIDILSDKNVCSNPADRCYYCKKRLFQAICQSACQHGCSVVFEGSNLDDKDDYRPGLRAIRELGVRSPLVEAGLSKQEIRALLRAFGVSVSQKPSSACLASRVACGELITEEKLKRVDRAESFLRTLGFQKLRVRAHGDLARLEFDLEEQKRFFDQELFQITDQTLRQLGFQYVCVDLGGYRPAGQAGRSAASGISEILRA